ncbi:MAG: GNAT family N-acetyltransferase, partial [Pseudomonadota bacterium]
GKGYATEAATAARDWAVSTLSPARLVSFIDPANTASQAVAKRLGADNSGRRAAHNPDCEVWDHPLA